MTSHSHHPLVKEQTCPRRHFKHYHNPGEREDAERAVKREGALCGGEQHSSSIKPGRIMQNFFHTGLYLTVLTTYAKLMESHKYCRI